MSSIVVALITTLGVIINSLISNSTNRKVEKIDSIKTEFKKDIDNVKKEQDKTYLTDFLADIENGVLKTDIQIQRAYEIYEEYKNLHGNSYVHDKWEELVKEGIL